MRHKYLLVLFATLLLCLFGGLAFADGPRLGLSVSEFEGSPLLLQHLKLSEGEGLMIRNVAVGGDLEAAGLSQGDILLAVDGHAMSKPQDLTDYISTLPKGTRVTLDVIQKGDHRQVYSMLDNLPDDVTWKYVDQSQGRRRSVGTPGRMGPSSGPGGFYFGGGGQAPGSSQTMMFSSIIQTDHGMEAVSTKITGDPADPNSEVEVTIGGNTYHSSIGEIDKLPDDARDAAKQALGQSSGFSFSFSFGGNFGSLFDELLRQQGQQIDLIEQLFFNNIMPPIQQMMPPTQQAPQLQPPNNNYQNNNNKNNNNKKKQSPLRIEEAPSPVQDSSLRS